MFKPCTISAIFASLLLVACSCSPEGNVNSSSIHNSVPPGGSVLLPPDPSSLIVVDQFGYLPDVAKVAVIRDPQVGFDAQYRFSPGDEYHVRHAQSGEVVFSAAPVAWKGGRVAEASGDRVWHFDFSEVSAPGTYVIVDVQRQVQSPPFRIALDVYRPVLVHAVRTFYYQRAGFAKQPPYADAAWQDGPSHLGPGQDRQARLYSDVDHSTTERDLHGGWYDAGDYNKYTNWHADYLIGLLHAYRERPEIWTDDFGLPESGNGVPDLLDEIRWGMDWLVRMQQEDGSVLSVMGLDHASPPSAAQGPSTYGPPSTSATYSAAAAFAMGSKIFASLDIPELNNYSQNLLKAARAAWQWAETNPEVTFANTGLLAAGEQEVDDYGRRVKRLMAAIYLYAATDDGTFNSVVEGAYSSINMFAWQHVYVFEADIQHALLYYSQLPGVSESVSGGIRTVYGQALKNGDTHWPALTAEQDAYRAPLDVYTWGSNRSKAQQGNIFYDQWTYGAGADSAEANRNAALRYLNYLHGVNPLGKVYLSNMGGYGAHNSVDRFYHSWFAHGSSLWSSVQDSTHGPAPGFLVGGPNPQYRRDSCCPNRCGTAQNNQRCGSASPSPPAGQPNQKSYLDFNDSWPINSWEVTENHNNYQVHYIRLLSKFVGQGGE